MNQTIWTQATENVEKAFLEVASSLDFSGASALFRSVKNEYHKTGVAERDLRFEITLVKQAQTDKQQNEVRVAKHFHDIRQHLGHSNSEASLAMILKIALRDELEYQGDVFLSRRIAGSQSRMQTAQSLKRTDMLTA